jgi:hypothetical protein
VSERDDYDDPALPPPPTTPSRWLEPFGNLLVGLALLAVLAGFILLAGMLSAMPYN